MRALELKIPPVVVFLVAAAAAWALARQFPQTGFPVPAKNIFAGLLLTFGIVVSVSAILRFREHETTVHPSKPEEASAIVTTGVYRFTRNPMYLGMVFALTAWGIKLGNLLSLACVPLFVAYMTVFQIRAEERTLRSLFGEPYDEYRKNVRRWL